MNKIRETLSGKAKRATRLTISPMNSAIHTRRWARPKVGPRTRTKH